MELLLALSITILTQGFKKLVKKFGELKAKWFVLAFVFTLAFIYSYLDYAGLPLEVIAKEIAKIGLTAIGIYEVIVKGFVLPIFNKLKK